MSRSGYSDDCEHLGLYRASVARALHGRRGQEALRDFVAALDVLPEKRLAAESFQAGGEVCSLGALAAYRGVDVSDLEPYHPGEFVEGAGPRFNIAACMAAEFMYENDECGPWGRAETPEERWVRMRAWAVRHLPEQAS